ncbi:MAG: MFS transporter, partial [candidate division Zixibacteria bacterium]|nr:MFS transporter [candidate division Zixibacteria bacterium]
ANALVSDLLPQEKRLEGYAITRAAGNLGWAVGPAIGGFLVAASYDILFSISALITFVSAVIFWAMLRIPKAISPLDRFRISDMIAIRKDPWLARHSMLVFLLYLVVAQLIVPFSVYAVEITSAISKMQLGYLFTLNGLMVVALQIPITRLLARFSLAAQMAQGAFLYAVGYSLIGWMVGFEYFAFAIVIVTLGEMAMSPPSLTMTSRLAPEGRMGRYMGIYSFFVATGWSIGPLFGGIVLDLFESSPAMAWAVISGAALLSCLGYLWWRKGFVEKVG